MRTAKAEGTFLSVLAEKIWCLLAVIPVLVFDCVALQLREGISGLLFRLNPFIGDMVALAAAGVMKTNFRNLRFQP